MEVISMCTAERYDLVQLETTLKQQQNYQWIKRWNAIELISRTTNNTCYLFRNGTIVTWGVKRHQLGQFIELVAVAAVKPVSKPIVDEMCCVEGNTTRLYPHNYFNVDMLMLASDEPDIRLAFSHGLSQSVKLNYHEQCIQSLIERYQPLLAQINAKGQFKLPRRRINRILGEILIRRSEINLSSNYTYQPKFFWENPSLESYYTQCERYLDIPKRAQTLNNQLDTLNHSFELINGYLENKHSYFLEIIIIVLITMELLTNLLNWHL